jgi:general nucleoside transport system permease protein
MSALLAGRRMRPSGGLLLSLLIPLVSVALALATSGLLLVLSGIDPIASLHSMFSAAFGSTFAIGTTVVKSIPRLLPALGIAFAIRAGLWNIGAEGQIYVGAIAATGIALCGPDLAFPLGTALSLLGAILAGAAWGAIPGVLRATRGISEVITSLMLVYVGIQLANYFIEGPWLVPRTTFPATDTVPSDMRLPIVWPGTLVNAGVILALAAVVLCWFLVDRTTFGLRVRALGGNPRAARVAGISVGTTTIVVMAVSGAFAGLAGGVEVLGARGRLIEGFSPGYGFEAIAIALLGRLSPVGVLGAALLFGALDAGGAGLQTTAAGASAAIVPITEGLAVVYVLIGLGIVALLSRRRRAATTLQDVRPDAPTAAREPVANPTVEA